MLEWVCPDCKLVRTYAPSFSVDTTFNQHTAIVIHLPACAGSATTPHPMTGMLPTGKDPNRTLSHFFADMFGERRVHFHG